MNKYVINLTYIRILQYVLRCRVLHVSHPLPILRKFLILTTLPLTLFFQHSLLLGSIHVGSTKFKWDLHELMRPISKIVKPTWISTNKRECVGKIVLESVLPL